MKAEIAKMTYLPLPRWAAVVPIAAVVVTGVLLIIFTPKTDQGFITTMTLVNSLVPGIVASVIGAWVGALEFSSGTLQRTLTAEANRHRVLASKYLVMFVAVLILGISVAATAGGMVDLGTRWAGIPLDHQVLARGMASCIPDCLGSATIGFAFGLLTRSLGGGIAISVAFGQVLSGILAFLPLLKNASYSVFEQDVVIHISGSAVDGKASHSAVVAVAGVLAWLVVLVVPGWVRFVRGDLK